MSSRLDTWLVKESILITNLVWYGTLLFWGFCIVVIPIVMMHLEDGVDSLELQIRHFTKAPFSTNRLIDTSAVPKEFYELDVRSWSGKIVLRGYSAWVSTINEMALPFIKLLTVTVIVFHLRKLLFRAKSGQPFAAENERHTRWIGGTLILAELAKAAVFLVQQYHLSYQLGKKGIIWGLNCNVWIDYTQISVTNVFIGLLVLILSAVFRVGTEMKDEQALTV